MLVLAYKDRYSIFTNNLVLNIASGLCCGIAAKATTCKGSLPYGNKVVTLLTSAPAPY